MFQRILFFLLFPIYCIAQPSIVPLEKNITTDFYSTLNQQFSLTHTAFKPLIYSNIESKIKTDSILYLVQNRKIYSRNWFIRKLLFEHFVDVDTTDFHLMISPLLDLHLGKGLFPDSTLKSNVRGIIIKGTIAKNLSFETQFHECQVFYPDYMTKFITDHIVIPGLVRRKGFTKNGWDYGYVSGHLSYNASKNINIQLGHDKSFVGDGYRSMLLSDETPAFPFFKTTFTFNRFQYTTMFALFQNTSSADANSFDFNRKIGTFNYLNYIVNKRLHIGLFESILWKKTSKGSSLNYNPMMFVPVILARIPAVGFNSENNALIGANFKFIPHKKIQIYGQFAFDGTYSKVDTTYKKTAFQLGTKFFEPLGIKRLYTQIEYNSASPYMYISNDATQNFTSFNQALIHPMGANFNELVFIAKYTYRRIYASYKFNNISIGLDSTGMYSGSNIYLTDNEFTKLSNVSDTKTTRGLKTNIVHHALQIGFIVNPQTNLQIFFSYNRRNYSNSVTEKINSYYTFGVKTSLANIYNDF